MKIYVPLNSQGVDELEMCAEVETQNLKIFNFAYGDYLKLEKNGIIDLINHACNSLIDLFEEEEIKYTELKKVVKILNNVFDSFCDTSITNLINKLIYIFELAINSKTYVSVYCYGPETF